jgi:hypothetical protein
MEPLLSKLPASESLTLTTAPTKVNCGSREACEGSSGMSRVKVSLVI